MRYIPHTQHDIKEMLAKIGSESIEELFESIPDPLRLEKPLSLPESLSEPDLIAHMKRLQKLNLDSDEYADFLGAGCYRHFSPSVVNHMILRGEFLTSYTPYQPEVSQGTLQAVFEFQTMICMLTGMDIANASMYDGASSLAEAVLMAYRVNGGNEVMIAKSVHPEYRQVVKTYLRGYDIDIIEIPVMDDGKVDQNFITENVSDKTCAVAVQNPNYFGVIEALGPLGDFLADKKTLFIATVVEALSMAILKPPGENGADIVVGEGQSFGLAPSFGGPYVGFFTTREKYFRQTPGRLVGETVDQEGRRAFTLTLAAREQHIRREKATSNICTNQGLCALAVTVYLTVMGKEGLRELAELNLRKAAYLKSKIEKLEGYKIRFASNTFNEFVVECPHPASEILSALQKEKIIGGHPLGPDYPEMKNCFLICVTETNTASEIDRLVEKLGSL
ncbi:MAG: aminomethyl-transferring glycine dehydrogenase subunit GcvPA [Nitrospinales bacterium]